MKPAKIFLAMAAFVIAAGVIAWGVANYAGGQFSAPEDANTPAPCAVIGNNHVVLIQNNKVIPEHSYGLRCETLTIKNDDDVIRLMAFGPHEHHVPYDGVREKVIGHNQSFTITLDATGTFHFHDHIHDYVTGEFTVD